MKLPTLKNREGFTIIEVVLVLAIAGLIFLIVFLALPQLQQSGRDSARRSDVGRLVSGINTYSSNNNGNIPADASTVNSVIIGDYVEDFDYNVVSGDPENTPSSGPETIQYSPGDECDGESLTGSTPRSFAVRVDMESGGFFCAAG